MSKESSALNNHFFTLLRTGLYGEWPATAPLPAKIDWEGVMALAEKHGVTGTVIESVRFLPPHLKPDRTITAGMNRFALGLIQTNLILDHTLGRLAGCLAEGGVKGIVLKGQGVARYYRVPQMRQCGDIDYFVGQASYERAKKLCIELLNDGDCHETPQHFVFHMGGVEIELHRLVSDHLPRKRSAEFHQWMEESLQSPAGLRSFTTGGAEVRLPSYDFDAFYIFYHAWTHLITGGIGLRQLCDWAMIFHYHSGDIDADSLVRNIRRFGLTPGWKLFAYIAVNHLGVAKDKIPLYDPKYAGRYERIVAEIVRSGNFGYHSDAGIRMINKGRGLRVKLGKACSLVEYLFTMFPIIPGEATRIFFNRLLSGTSSSVKRVMRALMRK